MNDYKKLMEQISVPEGLNDRVLSVARGHERTSLRPVLRTVACAALALMMVLGGVRLWEAHRMVYYGESSPIPELYFGITARAAGLGANNGVLLDVQDAAKLDGTTRTLSITYDDAREETGVYHLRAETLCTVVNEDGTEVFAPALSGETAETVTGLYAVPEDSRWFCWVVEEANTVSLSAPYGLRKDTGYFHSGIDIPAPRRTAVLAAADGTVLDAGFDTTRGNYLLLDHGDGLTTLYGHCEELFAVTGDTVTAGQTIAAVGATGMATGPHLHFEVRQDGEAQNPVAYFDRAVRDTLRMG